MEAEVILSLPLALDLLPARFGKDSRERPVSDEQDFGQHGFMWGCAETSAAADAPELPRPRGSVAVTARACLASWCGTLRSLAKHISAQSQPSDVV
jgi:hypothetical protein